eukprot:CAMPEP_0185595872 /NCGR_PEP_ID=MMETSP0434-20130131/79815_1 /TAXON_ID=626734 ORGANISM="Favella taraikaensis, Strain Fe Narragansett Bay" /NCGR_SAMPLE_ID=MMETSP0434 /ASSEMBLY_ACC=CAM_ASM_000379 /LENGTH=63 /DNA_ID=CAMNT_0028224161 /DNA_START=940 /DNA_END=1131 /DNA_ORIENTATION=-
MLTTELHAVALSNAGLEELSAQKHKTKHKSDPRGDRGSRQRDRHAAGRDFQRDADDLIIDDEL